MTKREYDVFLSHNRRQKPWVRDFYHILVDRHSVFFDEGMEPGTNWVKEIAYAIDVCEKVLFILSPSSVSSAWVLNEVAHAVTSDPDGSKNKVIPVVLEPLEKGSFPRELKIYEWVDLTNPRRQPEEWKKLLRCLGFPDDTIPPMPVWQRTVTVADKAEVASWGWDQKQLLKHLIALDYEVLIPLKAEDEGTVNQWAPVFWSHPHTWRLLVDAPESVVGYWHFVPLMKDDFVLAKQGQLYDSKITEDKVRTFLSPGQYDIYFVTVCMKKGFGENIQWTRLLFDSFFEVATELARQGCFLREVCANAYTPSGVWLCREFEMDYQGPHCSQGRIYTRTFHPFPQVSLLKKHDEMARLYTQANG